MTRRSKATAGPAAARPRWRPRRLRYWPLLVIGVACLGLVLAAQGRRIGLPILNLGFTGLALLSVFGPFRARRPAYDERERSVERDAMLFACLCTLSLVVFGAFAMGLKSLLPWIWTPQRPTHFFALGCFLMQVAGALAVLRASWKLPRPDDDAED